MSPCRPMQEGGRLGEAAELYESILRHFAGGATPADAPSGSPAAGADAGGAAGGSLLDVPPSALANLCVCYVIGSQNEAAEELLRRLEDETTAVEAGTAGAAAVPPHLSLANLAIGTLYCSKGGLLGSVLLGLLMGGGPAQHGDWCCPTLSAARMSQGQGAHASHMPTRCGPTLPQATLSLASRVSCVRWSRWAAAWMRHAGTPRCCACWP